MDARNFYQTVVDHNRLSWLGAKTNSDNVDCVYVRCDVNGCNTEVPIAEISNHPWETWEALLLCKRSAIAMKHVTRIVGYYSELQNWNGSKIAELKDRHKGEYSLPEHRSAPVVREPELEMAIA